MKSITQLSVFDYTEIEILGDLERLKLFFDNLDDDNICKKLELERGYGRNDYPVRTMLNLIYAMKIFGHRSVESFRRELSRNSQLRIVCGLSDGKYLHFNERKHLVPPARVFTNFLKKLIKFQQEFDVIEENLVVFMYQNLEGFGKEVAVDGKFIDSYAKFDNKNKCVDNRAEHDATSACKTYHTKDGVAKKEWHYGFRAHILCDVNYGLPIKHRVTPASNSEQKELDNILYDLSNSKEKYKLETMEVLLGDKGYDNGERNKYLKEQFNISAVIDNKYLWAKDEKYKEIENKMLAYNEDGEVFYIVDINKYEKLKYLGYDKQNNALRYTRYSTGKEVFRIPLQTDYRIFVPIARDSKKFKKIYNKRTEIERLNARLDRDYMFNDHFIRGKAKMNLMLTLSFIVMLTMAKGHILNKSESILSLVA